MPELERGPGRQARQALAIGIDALRQWDQQPAADHPFNSVLADPNAAAVRCAYEPVTIGQCREQFGWQ